MAYTSFFMDFKQYLIDWLINKITLQQIIYKINSKMSRQLQIQNKIKLARNDIKQIDHDIFKQSQKQTILDELMRNLEVSSSYSSSNTSSSINQSEVISSINFQSSRRVKQQRKSENSQLISDSQSIATQQLSFQIQKIKIFQKEIQTVSDKTEKQKSNFENIYANSFGKNKNKAQQFQQFSLRFLKQPQNVSYIRKNKQQKSLKFNNDNNIKQASQQNRYLNAYNIKESQKLQEKPLFQKYPVWLKTIEDVNIKDQNQEIKRQQYRKRRSESERERKQTLDQQRSKIRNQLLKQRKQAELFLKNPTVQRKRALSLVKNYQKDPYLKQIQAIQVSKQNFNKSNILSQTLKFNPIYEDLLKFEGFDNLKITKKLQKYSNRINKAMSRLDRTATKISFYKKNIFT